MDSILENNFLSTLSSRGRMSNSVQRSSVESNPVQRLGNTG